MPGATSDNNELKELFEFLQSPRADVRQQAANLVFSLSKDPSVKQWVKSNKSVIKDLLSLRKDGVQTVHDAFSAIINLVGVDMEMMDQVFTDPEFIFDLMHMIVLPRAVLADHSCMLLSNISKSPLVCASLLQKSPGSDTYHADHLLKVFVRGTNKEYNPDAEFHFLANVFANMTSNLPEARQFFMENFPESEEMRLSKLICFVEHENIYRRGGAISTIKNCCFNTTHHYKLLTNEELNFLPYLLLPLAGPEELSEDDMEGMPSELQLLEPDKKRESDATLRLYLVEIIVLLCYTRKCRDLLREKKAYPILRELDLWEKDERVKDAIYRAVNLLCRDDSANYAEEEEHIGDLETLPDERGDLDIEGEHGATKKPRLDKEDDDCLIEEL